MSPELLTLAAQLRANAERVRALNAQLPFEYSVEASLSTHSEYRPERDQTEIDTLVFSSAVRHVYRPDHMIGPFVGRRTTRRSEGSYIYLPDLEDVSEPSFLSHHCLAFGGIDTVGGRAVVRLDFRPLKRMREADAEGSFFLDPERFVAIRSTVRITRGEHLVPPIRQLEGETWYREIVPMIVVEDSAHFVQIAGSALSGGEINAVERQRVVDVHWRGPTDSRRAAGGGKQSGTNPEAHPQPNNH